MQSLRVRRLDPRALLPTRAHPGDAGLDLYALEPVELAPGSEPRSPPGSRSRSPSGHAGMVLPRSGLAARRGIALVNAPGLIDAGYRGELRVLLLNTDRLAAFTVSPGDRIAQLVLITVETPEVAEVAELALSERGDGGFGSSGG